MSVHLYGTISFGTMRKRALFYTTPIEPQRPPFASRRGTRRPSVKYRRRIRTLPRGVVTAERLLASLPNAEFRWTPSSVAGRVIELLPAFSAHVATSNASSSPPFLPPNTVFPAPLLSPAALLTLRFQHSGKPSAWIVSRAAFPYPPDLEQIGLDLDALLFVRLDECRNAYRAAEILLHQSETLVVLDLFFPRIVPCPKPLEARILATARRFRSTLLVLLPLSARNIESNVKMSALSSKSKPRGGAFLDPSFKRPSSRRSNVISSPISYPRAFPNASLRLLSFSSSSALSSRPSENHRLLLWRAVLLKSKGFLPKNNITEPFYDAHDLP
ncbi:MAG: hypothetical protein D6679_05230 [Candidatus Hydrogenedentota bacterium]|nr:MAG: hypothetical protein D6679_05230 [Candidatus Hydrogenedentota bacterium]